MSRIYWVLRMVRRNDHYQPCVKRVLDYTGEHLDGELSLAKSIDCAGDLGNVDRALHYLYRIWLPSVAFEPADLPAMEVFVRLPEEIGCETFDLQACIPVAQL